MLEGLFGGLVVFLSSMFKYGFASFMAVTSNMPAWLSYSVNIAGGVIGVVVFAYLGAQIQRLIAKYLRRKEVKVFSKRTRMLVKLRKGYGLYGVAVLTPMMLSIPIGVWLALTITKSKRKAIIVLSLTCLIWSSLLYIPTCAFGVDVPGLVGQFIR